MQIHVYKYTAIAYFNVQAFFFEHWFIVSQFGNGDALLYSYQLNCLIEKGLCIYIRFFLLPPRSGGLPICDGLKLTAPASNFLRPGIQWMDA